MKNRKPKIDIIYIDDDIIALSKPSGVLTIPDRYDKNSLNLYEYLNQEFGIAFTVHRLDRETSGVIIFARNAEAHKHLSLQFQNHTVTKIYHAIVSRIVSKNSIDIDIPLIEDPSKKGQMLPSARGKESLTILKVLERFKIATLVELNLVTGRHHQIRVHCAAIGHPLLVDELYGSSNEFMVSTIKRRYKIKKFEDEKPLIARVTMHAKSITFIHPTKLESVTFTSPYPKDFEAVISVLRKYSAVPKYLMLDNQDLISNQEVPEN